MMTRHAGLRSLLFVLICLLSCCESLVAQAAATRPAAGSADLQMVVVLTRHGVRSPIHAPETYNQYSAAPWAQWDVPPAYLTAHGYQLMKLFGAWDREKYSREGLFAASGCANAAHVSILADNDERTRETGRALAEGMMPGCGIVTHSQPDGAIDPLYRPLAAGISPADRALATAAVAGRIDGDFKHLTEAYRPQLAALDRVLEGCGHQPANPHRTSIFDIPANLQPGSGESPFSARGPIVTASTLAEILLLEYTQGMSDANVGWGCVDGNTVRELMQIDTAHWEFGYRTPAVARLLASNILEHIRRTLEQSATGKSVPGALGQPGDRMVILVGHDTNIVTVAGVLGIDWVLDGRVDDSPPGGALVFELWRPRNGDEPYVRISFVTQTLEQMRNSTPLTSANPPAEAPVFVPACSRADLSCSWSRFTATVRQAIDPEWVSKNP